MKLFAAFSAEAPNKVFFSIVLGALAGVAYALLIPLVLASLTVELERGAPPTPYMFASFAVSQHRFAAVFFVTCAFILVARSLSQIMLLRVSMDMTTALRIRLYHRIARAPVAYLERVGSSRLINVLTGDVNRIVMGARLLPDLLISIVTLVGMLGFLLYTNSAVFWFVLGAIVVGAVTYQLPMYLGNRHFTRSRQKVDHLLEAINGLIQGAKELKLNEEKRAHFFRDMLVANEHEILRSDKRGYTLARAAMNYGDLISFFVIGVIAFVFVNYHVISNPELVGVIMALLYVTGPVNAILNFVPQVLVARISLRQLNEVLRELPEEAADAAAEVAPWQRLRFDQVAYRYQGEEGSGFQVGPLSFEIARGQVTFVVGGNGSGKSTLSKLITLHYLPAAGRIGFGAGQVDDGNRHAYRQQICAIYTDYYLFDRLWGNADEAGRQRINAYLVALRLQHKVSVSDGRFSTLALSDGQKKRLALLVALLEDRQLYLFDEWAADQDSTFKEVFYNMLLPELKARNKAVVVISHDDRYFCVADQLLIMEEGRLARVEAGQGRAAPPLRHGVAAPAPTLEQA
ncbi:cyclic peptide export ABC transporter [Duganella violaceipulchra]|uniref:ATP-binding cassette transporter n=1 Tax=Duganella violaceipulchra TaxID=2849652 RepID=A0AA41HBL9_9BURK|nr:cyclic peptide export ABC transporter [Duganella violaceicalia]MBV6325522.1 cyclic peptide export ABC transporter [Duganella violaceicalia]MCP2012689.1 putative ATP-binding cassette transporter [Duganella violaceicalia]